MTTSCTKMPPSSTNSSGAPSTKMPPSSTNNSGAQKRKTGDANIAANAATNAGDPSPGNGGAARPDEDEEQIHSFVFSFIDVLILLLTELRQLLTMFAAVWFRQARPLLQGWRKRGRQLVALGVVLQRKAVEVRERWDDVLWSESGWSTLVGVWLGLNERRFL